ncbi:uncharacterized protein LOC5571132 [Aedes aegypti]|uniref:Fork-head domain-containing protein n=3 Tax=Aedes aegypti TaxID=7159 RepID=A0A1S4FKJ7_AEDAE|nr:uncharacterized protein LOC5571132 [Aedes aegypti]XP_021705768.1 uncharacterized protein LOC5571132 [Aedes aegypti]XP_021705769.1 uncharacterized protein LOC5571132 [Aedes aegypti]XP_021705770.1 uncharacterized protein LOC5571132 [Aedes aegypti]XP_021705771.1 uncharacterized protein LOC5571132 [Aedes aegypti]XP_021705772.1 uncharacterized protein LOC5571132 [Aedes aegypti]XP_021705773.1 uncharacterized protein LOC5571132 [Aedes aegypti]
MSPERHPCQDDVDSGGGGGGSAIIGGHVTIETSSPVPSPGPDLKDTSSSSFAASYGSSMVLSSIPLEANHQLILQQHLAQQQQQQQHHIIATSGNTNQNSNSNSSAINSASNGSIGSNHSIIINNNTSFKNHNSNNIIISGSGIGGGGNSNNHTYTINLTSSAAVSGSVASHNGHTMIPRYGSPVSGGTTTVGHHHGHHQQQQFYSAPNNVSSGVGSLATAHSNGTATVSSTATVVAPPASSSSTSSSSKLVVLQQGHLGENYITTTDSMNGVGNIVLLATEQVEMSSAEHDFINNNNVVITTSSGSTGSSHFSNHHPAHHHHHSQPQQQQQHHIRNGTVLTAVNGSGGTSHQVVINTDEELTPLTWLHDKNLLKGINLSKVPVSSPDSPRQAGGHLSPTSDFVEDSSVSEDNTSSANSSSDQSIGVFCTETIPLSARHLTVSGGPGSTHHRFQLTNGAGGQQTITTINGNTIIEYPVISSDDKDLKSPSSTASCASSASSTSSLYNSATSPNPTSGSGQNGSASGASTPHQHFHKKYLREEHVKQLKQVSSSYVTPVKQLSSAVKYEEGEIIEERPYPPAAPMKNGYPSPNVSSDEYGSTYGSGGGSMRPPSPPLSPQHHLVQGQSMNGGIHVLPQHPPSSPQPQQSQSKLSPPKAKHPTNVPYDPLVHISSKPPFSFSSLIFMAIENAQQKALPVKEIYAWIVQHFPYFKTAPTGWKNSVRHNLSLNKCFQKVEKAANLGKGSLWMVEPQYRPNLIQALSRSPFHSGSGIDKTTYKAMQQQAQQQAQHQQRSTDSPTSSVGSSYSKDNFPYLASRLAPIDAQNGVHLPHHLNGQQQHPSDLDGDDFSRSSTPIDYDGDLPHSHQHLHHHHQTAPGGLPYHVAYHHPPPTSGAPTATSGGTNGLSNGYLPGGSVILPNGQSVPSGEIIGRDWSADTIDDVNAATAMLALKHGPKIFTEGFQNGTPPVITTSPSEDHTYSAGGSIPPSGLSERSSQNNSDNNSNGTSSDAAYESSEESHNLVIEDQEEQRRLAGVDALLNLAGITNYAPMSGSSGSTGLKRHAEPSSYDEPSAPMYGQRSPYHQPPSHHQLQQQLETTPPSGYGQQQPPSSIRSYYTPDDLSLQYSPSPSPSKKSKTLSSSSSSNAAAAASASASVRMLKKFKKKASWAR